MDIVFLEKIKQCYHTLKLASNVLEAIFEEESRKAQAVTGYYTDRQLHDAKTINRISNVRYYVSMVTEALEKLHGDDL